MKLNPIKKRVFIFALSILVIASLNSCLAAENFRDQLSVSPEQANKAYTYALQYVNNEVAYVFGGRINVQQYLDALSQGLVPGVDIGVDASALVVNSYKTVLPELKFWFDDSRTSKVADATSSILAKYNSKPLEETEVIPGDLIFFKDQGGNITGVAIFSHVEGEVIHFITASASQGKVVLTNARVTGQYWADTFAGFGRLAYPSN